MNKLENTAAEITETDSLELQVKRVRQGAKIRTGVKAGTNVTRITRTSREAVIEAL